MRPPFHALVLVAGVVVEVVDPPSDAVVLCKSAADCGDGSAGHGAVCDEVEPFVLGPNEEQFGICRDACRDDDDCSPYASCKNDLDSENDDWSGCVPNVGGDPY